MVVLFSWHGLLSPDSSGFGFANLKGYPMLFSFYRNFMTSPQVVDGDNFQEENFGLYGKFLKVPLRPPLPLEKESSFKMLT
jgi:hypothetical protein